MGWISGRVLVVRGLIWGSWAAWKLSVALPARRTRVLYELTGAVLCDGDELAVRYVTDHLVDGQALGSVNNGVPTVPAPLGANPLPKPSATRCAGCSNRNRRSARRGA